MESATIGLKNTTQTILKNNYGTIRTCKTCGKEFKARSSAIKNGRGIYCSIACAIKSRITKVKRVCPICGKEFEVKPFEIKRGVGIFCSMECSGKSHRRKVTRTCINCGKEFKANPSLIARGGGKYCSTKCDYKARRRSKVTRTCKTCGKEFEVCKSIVSKGVGKYCSIKCRSKAQEGEKSHNWKGYNVKRKCEICGKEFITNTSQIKRGGGKYCSIQCRSKAFTGENNPRWKRSKRICTICGKEFYRNEGGKYCSYKCMGKARELWVGEKSPGWRGGKIKRICKYCGKEFYVINFTVKNSMGIFCSIECKGLWQSKNIVGDKSPAWKGGISFEPYCPKFNKNLKERVRIFFNRKCILCGKSESELSYKLCVHHVDYNKNSCCNGTRDPLFVPLCVPCHMKTSKNRYEWEVFFRYYLALGYNNRCF